MSRQYDGLARWWFTFTTPCVSSGRQIGLGLKPEQSKIKIQERRDRYYYDLIVATFLDLDLVHLS